MIYDPRGKRLPDLGRDPVRTPMQWDAGPNAGFCPPNVQPWLPLAANYQQVNVEVEQADALSHLTLTRALLELRRARPALHEGSFQALESNSDSCFIYLRQDSEQRLLIALNFAGETQVVKLLRGGHGRILLSTHLDREEQVDLAALSLRSCEGCIIEIAEAG
jgi:alpha-glucosidase